MSAHSPVKRDRFEVRVSLGPDAIWERLREHPRVRESNAPAPTPAPPGGAAFLVARAGEHEIRLRHWAGPADAASPVIVLRLQRDGAGTIVRGQFEHRYRQRPLVGASARRVGAWVGAGLGGSTLAALLLAFIPIRVELIYLPLLLLLFAVPTILVFVPALMIWNGEVRKGFVGPLWELLGEVFAPIALPSADVPEAPFRHALPKAE